MVDGGMKIVQILLFVFNLLFVIAGIALIATGAYVSVEMDDYHDISSEEYLSPGILLITAGVLLFLIAFFGCFGAYKENYCLVMIFAVSLSLIFIVELAGAITAFVMRDQIEGEVKDIIKKSMINYNETGHEDTTKAWDILQEEFDCCGAKGYRDWEGLNRTAPPASCCKKSTDCTLSGFDEPSKSKVYQDGCAEKLEDWMESNIAIIGGVGLGLAFVQLVGVVLACCLASAIKRGYSVS